VEVAVFVAVGDGDGVMVGVLVLVEVGVEVGERNGTELQLRVMIKKAAIPRHMAVNEMYCCFSILDSHKDLILKAQRLAAQPAPAPPCGPGALGHVRLVVTILAGNPKSQFNVFSLSLGQVG
jgi:hypothetical protein